MIYLSDRSTDGPLWVHMVSVGRLTDGPVSYASPPSLVRWIDGLCVADGPMRHTVHYPSLIFCYYCMEQILIIKCKIMLV